MIRFNVADLGGSDCGILGFGNSLIGGVGAPVGFSANCGFVRAFGCSSRRGVCWNSFFENRFANLFVSDAMRSKFALGLGGAGSIGLFSKRDGTLSDGDPGSTSSHTEQRPETDGIAALSTILYFRMEILLYICLSFLFLSVILPEFLFLCCFVRRFLSLYCFDLDASLCSVSFQDNFLGFKTLDSILFKSRTHLIGS